MIEDVLWMVLSLQLRGWREIFSSIFLPSYAPALDDECILHCLFKCEVFLYYSKINPLDFKHPSLLHLQNVFFLYCFTPGWSASLYFSPLSAYSIASLISFYPSWIQIKMTLLWQCEFLMCNTAKQNGKTYFSSERFLYFITEVHVKF